MSEKRLREMRERFEAEWKLVAEPDIEALVEESGFRDEPVMLRRLLIALVRIDLEYRWRHAWFESGQNVGPDAMPAQDSPAAQPFAERPLVEHYLCRIANLGSSDDLPVDLITTEYRARHTWGDRPGHDEYATRFSRQVDALQGALAQIDAAQASPDDSRVELQLRSGARSGDVLPFGGPATVLVGRVADARLSFQDDPCVSKYHCRLELNPPDCYVQDLGSRTGTMVNGRKVCEAFLVDGDTVKVGETEIVIHVTRLAPTVPHNYIIPIAMATAGREARTAATSTPPIERGDPSPTATLSSHQVNSPSTLGPFHTLEVPGYEIVRELGRGGMGAVFQATRKSTGDRIALKIIMPSQRIREKTLQLFLREASVLSQLQHKRIVKFHEVGIVNGQLFIAMEYVDTLDLRAHYSERSRADQIRYYCGVTCQVLEALAYLHGCGTIHRDVKPSNVLVSLSGLHLRTKLADFGLAKSFENAGLSGITSSGEVRGTLSFMAPEQLISSRDAKPAVDIYSAGATLYYYLTGEYPFDAMDSSSSLKAVKDGIIVPLDARCPDLPSDLIAVVHKAMAKDPARRYSSARKMYRAIYAFAKK